MQKMIIDDDVNSTASTSNSLLRTKIVVFSLTSNIFLLFISFYFYVILFYFIGENMDVDFEQPVNYLTNDPIVREEEGDQVLDVADLRTQFSLLAESFNQQSLEVLSTPTVAGGAGETFLGFQVVTVKILVTILLVILVVGGGIVAGTTLSP